MSATATLTVTHDVTLTVAQLAQAFCDMDDDAQAQFFVHCARIALAWPTGGTHLGASWQWFTVGRHLATCDCSTEEGRDMVRDIYLAMVEGGT
jgi:hypothetical protein